VASRLTHADRIERSLNRLGFRLSRTGRTFRIMDTAGALAVNSKPAMSLTDIEVWIGDFIKPGGKRRSNRLRLASTATTVRVANGKSQVLDGPYADTKEQLGGYYLIDVADLDAALAWAAAAPAQATASSR
jgi:hypothetical protein